MKTSNLDALVKIADELDMLLKVSTFDQELYIKIESVLAHVEAKIDEIS